MVATGAVSAMLESLSSKGRERGTHMDPIVAQVLDTPVGPMLSAEYREARRIFLEDLAAR